MGYSLTQNSEADNSIEDVSILHREQPSLILNESKAYDESLNVSK